MIGAGVLAGVLLHREAKINHGDQLHVTQGVGHGMSLSSVREVKNEVTSITITATVTPADAVNAILDWSLDFGTETGSWGSETQGEVTDYATLTPESDGALKATLSCSGAFGTQMILTASVRGHEEVYATATVDYVQRYESATVKMNYTHGTDADRNLAWNLTGASNTVAFPKIEKGADLNEYAGGTYDNAVMAEYSDVYTIANGVKTVKVSVAASETYVAALSAAGITGVTAGEFVTVSETMQFNDKTVLDLLFLNGATLTNAQLNAFKTVLLNNPSAVLLNVKAELTHNESDGADTEEYGMKLSSVGALVEHISLGDAEGGIRF